MSAPESSFKDHEAEASKIRSLGFAVITMSDTRTEDTDVSGAFIKTTLQDAGHTVPFYRVLQDDREKIKTTVQDCLIDPHIAVIITNGGTGIAARDTTFDVVSSLLDKQLDGFGELFRMLSYQEIGPAAMLSRAVAGIAKGKVVFAIPGSTNAVRLAMEKLILPQAGHVYWELHKHALA
jgi:molybdopterin adenylyltransferase